MTGTQQTEHPRRPALRWPRIAAGGALVLLALWWIPRCVQAERACLRYKEACYGDSSNNVSRVLALADEAYRIDPSHYHFWALATEDSWRAAGSSTDDAEARRLRAASDLWCGRTLSANPWHPKARVIRAGLLAERNPAEALKYWQACVEWQYWEPFNHALLAELLARNGDFAAASNAMARIKGMRYYEETRALLDELSRRP